MEGWIQGLLWLLIVAACIWIVRRRIRKWKKGEYCDCCDGSCGGCVRTRKAHTAAAAQAAEKKSG